MIKKNNIKFIDLGLPSGILWGNKNLGAKNPESPGYYFRWGEKDKYNDTKNNYIFHEETIKKYFNKKNEFSILDDPSFYLLGKNYRTPRKEDFVELNSYTKRYIDFDKGIVKYVSEINNNSIILFLGGLLFHNSEGKIEISELTKHGYYWSRTYSINGYGKAYRIFSSGMTYIGDSSCYVGMQIRPIYEKRI